MRANGRVRAGRRLQRMASLWQQSENGSVAIVNRCDTIGLRIRLTFIEILQNSYTFTSSKCNPL